MSQERTTLEIIAQTVEEAVAKGLGQLGLAESAVDVEVLDPGSRGLFGLGSRQARVRLTIKPEEKPAVLPAARSHNPERPPRQASAAPAKKIEPDLITHESRSVEGKEIKSGAGDNPDLQTAHQVVSDLLEKMKVRAHVNARYMEPSEADEPASILVDIEGDDLSILIGRRSETLNALQYISSLIIGKQMGKWVPLVIDVQGYRSRRDRQLRQMARRLADQVVQTGRRQTLEPCHPMNGD
jgi:spoIIIJ-associated protein